MQQPFPATPAFMAGGGEMGSLTRKFNWQFTSIGSPTGWPQSLRILLGTILNSKFPMFLFWGPDLLCFYNDAFRPSLGNQGKHPAVGKQGREVWAEIWDFIGPLVDQVMTKGIPVWFEDQLVPFYRNGKMEDIYWTFSYSPVMGDDGTVVGVLVICNETTNKIQTLQTMDEAKTQLSFAIDAAELGTWELNPATFRFVGNDRLKSWFGLQPDNEMEWQLALNVIVEADRQRVTDAVQTALQFSSGGFYDIEYTVVNAKTKQKSIIKAKGKALFDDKQQPYRFNGIMQDITEEVLAREERQKLLLLIDNSVDLMAILKMDGTNSYINKAGRDLLGIEEDSDVTKIPIADFHTPEQLAFVETEILPNTMAKGRWAGQFAIRNGKTGEIIPLYNNCHRINDLKTGETIGVGTVMRDMRPELNARKELAENEERLKIAMEATELGMWELNMKTGHLIYNRRYLEILGFERGSQPGNNDIMQHLHPDDIAKRNAAVNEAEETGVLLVEFRVIHPDKSLHWVCAKGRVFYDDGHNPEKQLGTITDITAQKTMAQQLEQKVAERTRELQAANEELERKNKELASFAYVSSHDLQEPLRKIHTFISRVEDSDEHNISKEGKGYLERIKVSASRMQTLINDLLSFSRTNSAEKELVPTNIDTLLDEVQRDMQETIQRYNAVVEVSPLPVMNVIPFQLHQLFTNLIANALKFSKKDVAPVIKITSEYIGGENNLYHITVADNGIGFEPKYSTRIFEVFQRLHGRNEYEGTGIGLAICKKIAENHHGYITAEGYPGEGAVFNVYVPG